MRALIVDRSEICRSGLRLALEDRFDDCTICEAASVEEAIECLEDHGTDIVLLTMDRRIAMTDPAVIRLRDFAVETPVLVVGDAVSKNSVKEVLRNNIRGFLDRSASRDVTLAAIQLVLAGGQYFPPEAHDSFASDDAGRAAKATFPEDIKRLLTPRQVQVLQAISEGKSNKAIADELGISPGTVKVHVSNLMKDLQAKNRTQAVSIANNLQLI